MVFGNRVFILSLIAVAMMIIATACTGDDDDREPGARSGTGSGTQVADFTTPTPEEGEDEQDESVPGPDKTVVPDATVPPAGADDGTPSTSGLPAPESTGTPAPIAERTVTPDAEGVGPQGELAFPDVRSGVPDLENFTLSITGEINIVEQQEGSPASVDLNYEQSAPDTFYLFYDGDDEFVVEVWSVGDQMWITEEGEITEATDDIANQFDVGAYMSMLPEINRITDAEQAGEEEIEGYTATHYVIPAEDAISTLPGMQDAEVNNAEGSIDVWIVEDEELILRMLVDLQWTGADDSENSMNLEYQVTNVGETEEVQPPQD